MSLYSRYPNLSDAGKSITGALEAAYARIEPVVREGYRVGMPRVRQTARAIMFLAPVLVALFLIREFYPLPSSPRLQPGANQILAKPASVSPVFGEDFRIRVGALRTAASGRNSSVVSADFQIARAGNSCDFAQIPVGSAVYFAGPHNVTISFLGAWEGMGRFEVHRLSNELDSSLQVARGASESVHQGDLTITVSDRSDNSKNSGETITYTARSGDVTAMRESIGAGDVFRLNDFYTIQLRAIYPTAAEFAVRSTEAVPAGLSRGVCTESAH
jgi:hypothetical protein